MAVPENKLRSGSASAAPHRQALRAGAVSVFTALAFAPAAAADWRFEPTLNASAIYTDNVNQSASKPEDAMILSATPGFTLRSRGLRRAQATLQYGLTGVARFGGDTSDDLYHNLNAAGKAELVEDFLFVDGSARVSQELISLLGSPADAEINNRNRATVGTYSISPYIRKRLGTFANAQARYTASGAIFENDVAANSNANSFSAGLNSGTRFDDLSWGLNYSIRKAQNRSAVDTTFERASATAGYALTRKFRVFGSVGQDWNDYLSTSGTSGSSYSAGFGWSPTRRTSVEASVGERYFGRTFSLAGSHRTRSSNWNLRYSEDVGDITQQLLEESSKLFFVCETFPFLRPAADLAEPSPASCWGPYTAGQIISRSNLPDPVLVALGLKNIGITKGVYIIKSLTAGVSWNLGRFDFGLSAYDTKRLYQALRDAQDHVQGVIGSVSYRLTPQTTANSSLSLSRNSLDSAVTGGAAREDGILSFSLGLNHSFTDQLNGALVFRHTQRDSNAANSDYDENRLTATVGMRF